MTDVEEHILHDSKLIRDVLPPELSESVFEDLQTELEPHWSEMGHKGGVVPRLVCIQGAIDPATGAWPLYRHPADEQPPLLPWTPTVAKLVQIVSERLQQPINHTLIQCYRGGQDFISQHADKTLDIQRGSNIVNLSLGARRTMVLRPKKDDVPKGTPLPSTSVPMDHGSLFVLGWETNRRCTHEIKRDKRLDSLKHPAELAYNGCRISLTLRAVATYQLVDGTLYGQGAPKEDALSTSETEEDALLKAFSIENRRTDYDWDAIYGRGFNIVNFQIVNAKKAEQESNAEEVKTGETDQVSASETARSFVLKSANRIALLAIDLQNDFLSDDPEMFLAKRGNSMAKQCPQLLRRLNTLAQHVRANDGVVVFLHSVYGEVPSVAKPYPHAKARNHLAFNSSHHAGTHAGKDPCCVRGSEGARLHRGAIDLKKEGDLVMEKHYYSSFTGTPLHSVLQYWGVSHLLVTGLTLNNCVAATIRDAFHLGYEVLLPPDACAQLHPEKQSETVQKLEPYCHAILNNNMLLSSTNNEPNPLPRSKSKVVLNPTERSSGIGAGDSILIPNFLSDEDASKLYDDLLPDNDECEVDWAQLTRLGHDESKFPRLTAYQSDRNQHGHPPSYRCADPQPWHGQYETVEFTPWIRLVKDKIERIAKHSFNWSRILCYRDENDGMGFHSDKCLDLRDGAFIASLSLGQAREYELQPKKTDEGKWLAPQKLTLVHNTLLLLGPETNRLFIHSVKKASRNSKKMKPRLSITFRDLATWYVSEDSKGSIWPPSFYGQGAQYVDYDEYRRAQFRKRCWSFGAVAFLSVLSAQGADRVRASWRRGESQHWLKWTAAGVTACSAAVSLYWTSHRHWENQQLRLSQVYRLCNVQALTPVQAKQLLLFGTGTELQNGVSTTSIRCACGRDS